MKLFTVVSFILCLFAGQLQADELSIGIKEAKPFAYQVDGNWKGLSVDLIHEIAKENNFTYKFVDLKDTPTLLTDTENAKVHMSIAAISMTYEREKTIDFSHRYFTSSLGILSKDKNSWIENVIWMVERLFLILVGFIVSLYIVGFIMDKLDGDDNIKNPHEGAWWALVTFTTTGYGDLVPKTTKGKLVASVWMVASLFLLSIFTGYVASTMTVKKLTEAPTTLADLYTTKVAVVKGSTAQLKLMSLGIKHTVVANLNDGLKKFNANEVNVVIHDDAMLKSAVVDMDAVSIWNIENSEEYYAVALPPNSDLTKRVNLTILKLLASPEWKAIQLKHNVL